MSHLRFLKVEIKNPVPSILEMVINDIVKLYNGYRVNTVRDASGRTMGVQFGVHIPSINRSVGLVVKDNRLEIVMDTWNVAREKVEEIKTAVQNLYVANATVLAMSNLGYAVQNVQAEKGRIVMEVVK